MAKTKIPGEYLKDSVVRFTAKAGENITKGQSVYISGISGEVPVVSLADADDTNKMPAFGLAESTVSTNGSIEVTSNGTLAGIDTSSYALGDILYISTTAGSLTNDPSGLEASKVQNIGMVQRVHASNGSIKVGGAGRTNATPNLNDGNIFVGNSSNKSVSDAFTDVLNDQAGINSSANATAITIDSSENVGIGVTSPDEKLDIEGNLRVESTSSNGTYVSIRNGATNGRAYRIGSNFVSGVGELAIYDDTASAERMRIDSSGNLLHGTSGTSWTDTAGTYLFYQSALNVTRDGAESMNLNRLSSDGVIATFRKDGTTVGSIGSRGGAVSYIVLDPRASGAGLTATNDAILPADETGSPVDNNTHLGSSSVRFKDLYLSGGVTTGAGTAASPAIKVGDSDTGIWHPADNILAFSTWGSERLRIDPYGNVGIGLTNPSSYYSSSLVVDAPAEDGITIVSPSNAIGYLMFADGTSGSQAYEGYIAYNHLNNYLHLRSNDHIKLETNSVEAMRIDSSGKVGIGTAPSEMLHIKGGGNGPELRFENSSTSHYIRAYNNNWNFLANGTTAMTIKDSGQVNFGAGLGIGGTGTANTLDDYEEGTFTPTFSNGSFNYSTQDGRYTKIGRQVTLNVFLKWTSRSGSGIVAFGNFPFVTVSSSTYRAPGSLGYTAGLDFAGRTVPYVTTGGSVARADIYVAGDNLTPVTTDVSNLSGSGELQLTITYITD